MSTRHSHTARVDYALVGGGLQNGLIALALGRFRPGATFALIEKRSRVGGNHLWSFHAGDLSPAMTEAIAPAVAHRWPAYRVRFPSFERELDAAYASVPSERFHDAVSRCAELAGSTLITGLAAVAVEPHRVTLVDGSEIFADVVIDARGPADYRHRGPVAYQKFVGLELALEHAPESRTPLVMDSRVAQKDGYRFMYVLPLDERRVLIEDTYFSDSPKLDRRTLRAEVIGYALAKGLEITEVVREECGVLPLPHRLAPSLPARSPFVAGYAGGWFHPTTGYSFPAAARVAELVAGHEPGDLSRAWEQLEARHRRQARFSAMLNRLLFDHFEPRDRWNVLERFYRLPEPTIRRFYALNSSAADRTRVLCGRPPRGLSLSTKRRASDITKGATL